MVDTTRLRGMADRQIRRLGGRKGAIKRVTTTGTTIIPIMASVTEYSPRELRGELYGPTDRRCCISTYKPEGGDLGTIPNKETDTILLYRPGSTVVDVELIMAESPKLYEPHGVLVLIELQVRR
jgi:hypothetical protein